MNLWPEGLMTSIFSLLSQMRVLGLQLDDISFPVRCLFLQPSTDEVDDFLSGGFGE